MVELRTIIVDDEPLARRRLRRMLRQHPEIEIVGRMRGWHRCTSSGRRKATPTCSCSIFKCRESTVSALWRALPSGSLPIVVFVTAFDQHAIHAFEACALDYLLKPVSPARLAKTHRPGSETSLRHQSRSACRGECVYSSTADKKFLVRSGQRTSFVSPQEIDWIEADGNYAILHAGGRNHLLRSTMSALEASLPSTFLRASRFAILNLRRVKEIQSVGNNHFAIMSDDTKAPLTCSIREIQERLRAL